MRITRPLIGRTQMEGFLILSSKFLIGVTLVGSSRPIFTLNLLRILTQVTILRWRSGIYWADVSRRRTFRLVTDNVKARATSGWDAAAGLRT
jgi:hypothetical protein